MTQTIKEHAEMTRVSTYDEVREVLRSSAFWPSMFVRVSGPLLDGTLMTLSTEEHLRRRRTEVVLFSRVQLMEYELNTVVPALREQLDAALASSQRLPRVDIMQIMRNALLRVTGKVVGIDDLHQQSDVDELREMAEHFGEGSSAEWALKNREAVVAAAVAAKNRFGERFFAPARQRRAAMLAAVACGDLDESELPNDLITLLLRHYGDWETERLLREVVFYVTASANTTTHLAPHVLYEVLRYVERCPAVRDKAGDLGFLQRTVSEGLRLHPTVPALLRLALEDVTMPSGRRYRAGEQLLLDLNAANRDERVFGPTAWEFDPYRTLPPRVPPYGLAFGDGAHTCLGRQLAVGAGNGLVGDSDIPVGVLTRLLYEVLQYAPALDPADPPVYCDNTATMRFARFPVVLHNRPSPKANVLRSPVPH